MRTAFSGKELIYDDLHRIEPVHELGLAAGRNPHIIVPFTEIP